MANIEKHISDLMSLHDCVIVPGLGGFVANHKPAIIVEERNFFRPPSKEIGFNRSLSHNDGLLANHLCLREQLSWEQSMSLINDFVSDIQLKINGSETVEFEGVGSFRKDALGNLQFMPNERNQLLTGSFGLDDFHFEPLYAGSAPQKHEEPVRRLLRSRSPRYWASVAAMLAGLFFFSSELKMPEHQQIDTASLFTTNEKVEDISNTTAIYNDELNNTESTQASLPVKAEITKPEIKPYHLIAGSFAYEAPARQILEELQGKGFSDATIIRGNNDRFRVSLNSFDDRNSAVEELFALRKQKGFENIWLLTN